MSKIRVLHVDDHVAFSDKLREILAPEVDWLGAVNQASDVVARIAEQDPDVILLDVSLPGKSGIELAREIVDATPSARIIMVTVHGEPAYLQAAFDAGASGYVLKSSVASEIVTAVHDVFNGKTFLSRSLGAQHPRGFFLPN